MLSLARPLVLAALFAGAATGAGAQTTDSVNACVNAAGKLRIVAIAGQCVRGETALSWNRTSPSDLHLVGFTVATIPGGAGLFEWTRACGADFPGARVCQVSELVLDRTPALISSPEDLAWVLPNTSAAGNLTGVIPQGATCAASDNSGGNGLAVNGHGFFGFRPCSDSHRVACCAPTH